MPNKRRYRVRFPLHTMFANCGTDFRKWVRTTFPKGGNYEAKYPMVEYTMDGRKVLMTEDAQIKYLLNI